MISIAMATYNGANYLREQIDSILTQTIQDIELVISDDCSTDDTWGILQEYSEIHPNIKVYRNADNLGFKKNFEKVIGLTTGDYIALSDQDDIWLPNHLEVLLKGMKGKTQLVCARPIFVDQNNRDLPLKFDYFKMHNIPNSSLGHARHILLGGSSYQGASMLIRRTFVEMALPIPNGANYHDSWFAVLACFAGGLTYINKPIVRYRRLDNSVTVKSKYQSPFRCFVGSVLVNHALLDRLALIDSIKDRIPALTESQLALLNIAEKMLRRRGSLLGRLANIPYYITNFQTIYATDGIHLFS